tara:strand:- start:6531 stop:6707 length:177 start_codon:yes stop_codon:yes gene_type:complete
MCGSYYPSNIIYSYVPPFTKDKELHICKKCSIKEYYGTSYSKNKKYKKDIERKRLFKK